MGFVKLDTGLLDSSLWDDKVARDVFLTALLMSLPFEATDPIQALELHQLVTSGFVVPPGWYGMVESSGKGIVRRSLSDLDEGMAALERLGAPDPASRSSAFDGRRLVRVGRGFLVLNFFVYRDRDYTSAVRSKRYRDRKKELATSADLPSSLRSTAPSRRVVTPSRRSVTEAEAGTEAREEAKADAGTAASGEAAAAARVGDGAFNAIETLLSSLPASTRMAWQAEIAAAEQGMHGPSLTRQQIEVACRDYVGNGNIGEKPSLRHFRAYLRSGGLSPKQHAGPISKQERGRASLAEWVNSGE
jgi:hypothetical protein